MGGRKDRGGPLSQNYLCASLIHCRNSQEYLELTYVSLFGINLTGGGLLCGPPSWSESLVDLYSGEVLGLTSGQSVSSTFVTFRDPGVNKPHYHPSNHVRKGTTCEKSLGRTRRFPVPSPTSIFPRNLGRLEIVNVNVCVSWALPVNIS